jgi:hypothetical protein
MSCRKPFAEPSLSWRMMLVQMPAQVLTVEWAMDAIGAAEVHGDLRVAGTGEQQQRQGCHERCLMGEPSFHRLAMSNWNTNACLPSEDFLTETATSIVVRASLSLR